MSFVKVRFLKSEYLHCSVSTYKNKSFEEKYPVYQSEVLKEKIQNTKTIKYLKNRLLLRGKVVLTFSNASQFMLHVNATKIHI